MNIQRFTAPTSREALAKARAVFGDGTLILSNRPVPGGVEVVATAEDALAELDLPSIPEATTPTRGATPVPAPVTTPDQDSEQLAMSTLSFQDYVRERMLRRRHEAAQTAAQTAAPMAAQNPPAAPVVTRPAPARVVPAGLTVPPLTTEAAPRAKARSAPVAAVPMAEPAGAAANAAQLDWPTIETAPLPVIEPPPVQEAPKLQEASKVQAAPEPAAEPAPEQTPAPVAQAAPEPTPPIAHVAAPVAAAVNPQGIVNELQAMKAMIDERFNTLAWLGETRQDPIRANLMLKLIRAGYSPTLSRTLIEHMPEGASPAESVRWLTRTLERSLHTDSSGHRLVEEGGIFALVGATGVGKTTTVAKLAGLCAREHGTASVGLVTLDTFRVGAHEQLRAHARQFGVVAHQAHDRAALAELLNLFANRHMVLIDTTGVAPSDPRMRGMLAMLDLPGVNRLLVLNAGAHGDTLDHVLSSFKGTGTQHAILSKLDEAVKLGPALDTLIRHEFVLRGVTNGQRVPDDWDHADAATLVAQSMRAPSRSAFDPQPSDLNFFFSPDSSSAPQPEAMHA